MLSASDSVPDLSPVMTVPAYLAEPNNLALAVPVGGARRAGLTAVTWPPQGGRQHDPPNRRTARTAGAGRGLVG